jgi:hypothetical protein
MCADPSPCTYILGDYGQVSMSACDDDGELCTQGTECDGICRLDCQPGRFNPCDVYASEARCTAFAQCVYIFDATGTLTMTDGNCFYMSCPFLYLWDGDAFRYHTDLAGSVLGYGLEVFRPEHYDGGIYGLGDYASDRGVFRMKIRETIHEADYFDKAELVLADVPEGYGVLNTWSFTSQLGQTSPKAFVTVRNPRPPVTATDPRGRDVRREVSRADEIPLPVSLNGASKVVVDFGPIRHPQHAKLVVTAWSHYRNLYWAQKPPYSAGTTIETRDANGRWVVRRVAGKNPGDRRTWAIDIAGIPKKNDTLMRITLAHQPTGLDVLDRILLDDSPPVKVTLNRVRPAVARLRFAGSTDFVYPTLVNRIHADDSHHPVLPDAVMYGSFTRYGDVRRLLRDADDRFVVMAHGDELVLEFKEPPLTKGMQRHAFLDADVFYTIKYSVRGFLTDSIDPLPFHGMKTYPYDENDWPYHDDPTYHEYLKTWNTRRFEPKP